MIQLFNLDLDEIGKWFSSQDLREAVIQDSIIIVLCQGKCFKLLTNQKFGLHEHLEEPDKLIPFTFEKEINFLDSDTMSI
jgi:hypothetical protein